MNLFKLVLKFPTPLLKMHLKKQEAIYEEAKRTVKVVEYTIMKINIELNQREKRND